MKRLFCAVCGVMVAASGVAGSKAGDFPDVEGVVVHLDASDLSTIMTNELGQVTNWVSKTDNGLFFYNDDALNAADTGGRMAPPMWTADGSKLGGPAVRFGYNPYESTKSWNVLAPSILNKLPHRTVALVCKTPLRRQIPCNLSHVWGRNKGSTGLGTQSNDVGDGSFGTSSAWISGGRAWVDGALAYDGSNVDLQPIGVGKGDTHTLFVTEAAADVATDWSCSLGGSYYQYGYVYSGTVSEFIAFDRVLDDDERAAVTAYLQNKWMRNSWTGAGDGENWNDPGNWFLGHVPTAAEPVALNGATVRVSGTIESGLIEGGTLVAQAIYTANIKSPLAADVKFETVEREALPVLAGLVAHFDASDLSTMTLDKDDNRVLAWQSRSANGLKLEYAGQDDTTWASGSYSSRAPVYDATTGINGRPAVAFGYLPDLTTSKGTILRPKDGAQIKQRTLFVVCRVPDNDYGVVNVHALWGKDQDAGYGLMCQLGLGLSGQFSTANAMIKDGFAWVNGELAYDGTDEDLKPAGIGNRGKYDLIAVESAADKTFQPSLGGVRYQWGDFYRGRMGELVVYDRVLTADERRIVTAYLQDRWMGGSTVALWSGVGDGESWHDAANWIPAREPDVKESVDLMGATVRVSGAAEARDVVNGTLVAVGAQASVKANLGDDVTVRIDEGTKLTMAAHDASACTVELNGGTLAATTNFAYHTISGCVLDLDASDFASLTLDGDDQVLQWKSKTANGVSFIKYPNAYSGHSVCPPLYRAEGSIVGKPAVEFGAEVGTVLQADGALSERTLFFVFKGYNSYNPFGGQQGLWSGSGNISINGSADGWGYQAWDTSTGFLLGARTYISGGFASDGTAKVKREFAFEARPIQLMAVRRAANAESTSRLLGVGNIGGDAYMKGEIYEVVVYDRELTDDEFNAVQTSLMSKWAIDVHTAPGFVNALSTNMTFAVAADSTVEAVGDRQSVSAITLDAGTAAAYPLLAFTGLAGTLDLSAASLTLVAENELTEKQDLVTSGQATIKGPLASVEPATADVRCRSRRVCFGRTGCVILVR